MSNKENKKESNWDGKFNGTYATSRYADRSLEDDILDAGCGKYIYEGPKGELIRVSDSRIDVWGPGDGKGNYDHYYYNGPNDHGKAPDGRHN